MREALAARSGRDFITAAPPGRPRRAPPAAWRRALFAVARRPAALAGGAIVAAGAVAIALNALAYQTRVHPAPFFAARDGSPPPRMAVPARPAPAPLAAPVPLPPARPAQPAPSRQAAADPIGDIIRGGAAPTPPAPANERAEPTRAVLQAQKALVKLGYGPLDADGLMGPDTRAALKRFEKDRKLAVTGELGARTARDLSAQAGVSIE